MRYEGQIYRPPSEADSYILQATVGCSWNHCTYCDMYRAKQFRVRDLDETLTDVRAARQAYGSGVEKVFVADGDALVMDLDHWEAILSACRDAFPRVRTRLQTLHDELTCRRRCDQNLRRRCIDQDRKGHRVAAVGLLDRNNVDTVAGNQEPGRCQGYERCKVD